MKRTLLKHFLIMACCLTSAAGLLAQSIHVVPNPTSAAGNFSWASTGGALSGYSGTPIVFNNSLVLEYNATNTSDITLIKQQLAVYKDGDSLHLIPNPDAGQGVYFQSTQIIFNSKLFFIYINAAGVQQLASFDGTSITLYPNPDAAGAGTGFVGSPRIYNNALYVAYVNVSGVTQFGTFNGSGISLIPNPDASATGFFNDYAVVFNNTIVSRYVTADANSTKHLAVYNGTSWTILPNPDNTTRGVTPAFPALYHNKLYWRYFSAANQYQLLQYDGTSNPVLIANPEDDSPTQTGVASNLGTFFPIISNDSLFFQYADINNVGRLAKFDGTTVTLIPNPDATTYGFYNTPIVYNNNLYIFYVTSDGLHHIGEYEPASNSIKVYPNPDGGSGYWDQPIIYNNNLYFQYYNASGLSQLGYFGGTSIKLVANPAGAYSSPNGNNGYLAQPIIWNNLLYMQIASVPYANAGNLGIIDGSTLPVSLLSFTARKNGNTSLLQWSVASESNNAYFLVEHSKDGISFQPVGKVAGHGTISLEQQYQFTDVAPAKGLNFYRLKQVNYDGNYTYSIIETLTFDNIGVVFKIFPNPTINNVELSLPSSTATSTVSVYDLGGKKLIEKQIIANTVSQSINVSALPAGVYNVTLIQESKQQTLKLEKK